MVRNLTPPGIGSRARPTFPHPDENATRQAAVFGFQLGHLRNDGAGAHLARVASIDRAEQRFHQVVDRFLPVVIHDKLSNTAVCPRAVRLSQEFQAHAQLGSPTEEPRGDHGHDLGGHHHRYALGDRHKTAFAPDVGAAIVFVGANHLSVQANFTDEFALGGLGGNETVRPVLDQATLQLPGLDDTAQLRSRLNQRA